MGSNGRTLISASFNLVMRELSCAFLLSFTSNNIYFASELRGVHGQVLRGERALDLQHLLVLC